MSIEGFLGLVVVALASYRATRVVVEDSISDGFRAWVWRKAYRKTHTGYDSQRDEVVEEVRRRSYWWEKAYQLVSCPHCTGFWMSLGTFSAWRWGPTWADVAISAVAVAGLQSFVSSRPDA